MLIEKLYRLIYLHYTKIRVKSLGNSSSMFGCLTKRSIKVFLYVLLFINGVC